MRNLLVLMLLLITLFALMGMQLFGGKFVPMTGYSTDSCAVLKALRTTAFRKFMIT